MVYKLIRSEKKAIKLLRKLDNKRPVMCDTETCTDIGKTNGGLYGQVRLIQIYQKGMKYALLIDIFFVPLKKVLKQLKKHNLVFHNASYDLHTINCYTKKTWLPTKVDDTFYLSKIAYPRGIRFGFYDCLNYAGCVDDEIRDIDKKAQQKADWGGILTPLMLKYAAYDVLYLSMLFDDCKHKRKDSNYKLDVDNLKYAIGYDRRGLHIDQKLLRKLRGKTIKTLDETANKIPVNINSSKQCSEWLGTSSSDIYTLGTLALEGDERAEMLITARKAFKLLGFINKYNAPVIRGFHNANGTRTGRMSCTGGDRYFYENNQNPPKVIFPCIVPAKGEVFVYKDYSGLELRMAVAMVGERVMYDTMMAGKDVHTETGCVLFDATPETLDVQDRIITKFYNFGTVYGAHTTTLRSLLQAQGRLSLSYQAVDDLRKKWLNLYTAFRDWHNMTKRALQVYGYIDTVTCLQREARAYKYTDALNFAIQGSAAEVTKTAVHYLYERYKEPDIVNVVHDSICLSKPEKEAPLWVDRLNECMIDAWYDVIKVTPLPDLVMPAEAKIARSWDTENKYPV